MRWRTWSWAALALATLCSSAEALDGRRPGSVLVYPIHRSGTNFTILSVTNTALEPQSPFQLGGGTGIAWRYINIVPGPSPLLPLDCRLVERIEYLTPGDTTSIMARCHNATPNEEGFVLLSAQDPNSFKTDWSHNFLIGNEIVINEAGGLYIIEAIPFRSPQPRGSHTDDGVSGSGVGLGDADGEIDFDGIEYEGVPDHLFADSFIALPGSSLTLLNLSGGAYFNAVVGLDIWNDAEHPMSFQFQFRCWFEEELADLSLVFSEQHLALNTPQDPTQLDIDCDGVGDIETGWFRVRGVRYFSDVDSCLNPALLGAITSGPSKFPAVIDGGVLLWESDAVQLNGDFYKFATNDLECPEFVPVAPICNAGAGPISLEVGESILFDGSGSSDPNGQIVAFLWNFGDGSSATTAVASHTYRAPGSYTSVLTITDNEGLKSSCQIPVQMNARPTCDIAPVATVDVGVLVLFDATGSSDVDGTIVRFDWDFGDGSVALNAGPTPSHTYATAGTFAVTLTVTDDDGSVATCTTSVSVNAFPLCNAGPAQSGNVGDVLTFDGSGSSDPDGTIAKFDWNFGDGSSAPNAGPMPGHPFATAGVFTVTLTVTDDDGAVKMCTTSAIVNAFPICNAGPMKSGNVGDVLTFDGSGSSDPDGTIVKFDWDFGDGSTALNGGPMPSHAYAAHGLFTVTLAVTDDDGAVKMCTASAIVNAFPLCNAGPPQSGNVGAVLKFDGSLSSDPDGTIAKFDWDFGDGSTALNAGPMPSHAFATAGTFLVTLTVTDDDGAVKMCTTSAVVNAFPICNAGPTQSGNVGDVLTFNGSGSSDPDGTIVKFDWMFGDGSMALNAGPTPSHAFLTQGLFTVKLTVTDDDGAVKMCTTSAIVNAFPICNAGPPQSGNVGDVLTFNGSGSSDPDGTIVKFDWLFGDGNTALNAGPMPGHAYSMPGVFTVILTVTDDDGAVKLCSTSAIVNAFPVCSAGPPKSGNVGDVLTFDGSGSSDPDGTIAKFDWDFGDGSTALNAGPMPGHPYATAGVFTVTLTVTDDDGAVKMCTTSAIVNAFPICNAGPMKSGNVGDVLTFDGSGSSDPDGTIAKFDWNFGDGSTALNAGPMPSHAFATAGTFLVTLTVTDDDGAVKMCTTSAIVNAFPICNAGPPKSGNVGDVLTFDGSGSSDPDGTIAKFDWGFGDGSTAPNAGPMPSHAYATAGTFTVTLKVTDDDGAFKICTTSAVVNAFPLCNAGPPKSGNVGDVLTFDGSGSSDPDGTIVKFDWDFGDGSMALNAGPMPGHAYATAGVFTVKLTVTDDDGATKMCTTSATVNAFPLCNAGPPQSGNVGDVLTFDGSGSSDPDGTIVKFDWVFGDGSVAGNAGPMPGHAYATAGTFTVMLRVTDDDGAFKICTTSAVVNAFPICDAGPMAMGLVGEVVAFDGSGSSDPDGTIVRFDWDFGDGNVAPNAGPMTSHAFATFGDFTVKLTVTDDDGAVKMCTTLAKINAPPVCAVAPPVPPAVDLGQLVFFDGSGSMDPDGTIVTFDWDFGDGAIALDAGPMPSHAYAVPGTYFIFLTVTDDDGASDSCGTLTPLVVNAPPICAAGGPYQADLFDLVQFDGSGSSDPDGTIVKFDWDFGDGSTAPDAGPMPTHVYTDYGRFTITLTVTDSFGKSETCTASLEIMPFSGAIVFSGDDTDQHCFANLCGSMGPKLIQWVLDHSQNAGKGILVVGQNPAAMPLTISKIAFDTWMQLLTPPLDPTNLADVRRINDPAQFALVNFDDYKMIFIPAFEKHTNGGVSQAMINALLARKADLEEYVLRRGGGIYALTEATDPSFSPPLVNGWAWSPVPFTTHDIRYFEVCPSGVALMGDAGVFGAPLPGTDCSDSVTGLAHEAWHNTFLPDPVLGFSGLEVFAIGNELVVLNEATVIGGIPNPPSFPLAVPRPPSSPLGPLDSPVSTLVGKGAGR